MEVWTKNGPRGRNIQRANRETWIWSYSNLGSKPCVAFTVQGADENDYTIKLTDNDIEKINEARQRYAKHFKD